MCWKKLAALKDHKPPLRYLAMLMLNLNSSSSQKNYSATIE